MIYTNSYADNINFSKYRGATLKLCFHAHPHFDAAIQIMHEFTELTGIILDIDRVDSSYIKDKQLSSFNGNNNFDLVSYLVTWKSEYAIKNYIIDLNPYFANKDLILPNYNLGDLITPYLMTAGFFNSREATIEGKDAKLYGIPFGAETSILAYRKDVFLQNGLKKPNTYSELKNILSILENLNIGGLSTRGEKGHHCVHSWLLHFNPMGGQILDENWHPKVNSEAGVKSLDFLRSIISRSSKHMSEYNQAEMLNSFLTGESNIYLDSSLIINAPKKRSQINFREKVGFALHPKDQVNSSESGGLAIGISSNSLQKEAAFLLLQWLTHAKQDIKLCKLGGAPSRISTLKNPLILKQFPGFKVLNQQLQYININWRPTIPEWDYIDNKILGNHLHESLLGNTNSKIALATSNTEITNLMRTNGYLK